MTHHDESTDPEGESPAWQGSGLPFRAKGVHRIDARCPARGHQRRDTRHRQQRHHHHAPASPDRTARRPRAGPKSSGPSPLKARRQARRRCRRCAGCRRRPCGPPNAGEAPMARRTPSSRRRLLTSAASSPYMPSAASATAAVAKPPIRSVVTRRATSWSARICASEAGRSTVVAGSAARIAARMSGAADSGSPGVRARIGQARLRELSRARGRRPAAQAARGRGSVRCSRRRRSRTVPARVRS